METTALQQPIPAFNILKLTLGLVPIIVGLDKFTNILTDWAQYIDPVLKDVLPFSPPYFMMLVGVVEIIAGILIMKRIELGQYILFAWLTLVALILIVRFDYIDIAIRALLMAMATFTMARMAKFIE